MNVAVRGLRIKGWKGWGLCGSTPSTHSTLFTQVRGIEILRSSPFGHSANFALTQF